MQTIGMRTIFPGPGVAVFELRGGTHLVVIAKDKVAAGDAPFDLMVEDLHATHRQFTALGLEPTPIEAAANMHYAAEYETVAVAAASGRVKPAKRAADKLATRGNAPTGAQLRGKSEPRRTR